MLVISKNSNLLEQDPYRYSLQNISEPHLYREFFPYDEVPKVSFNFRQNPICMPEHIWITDTTFRDGQQSRVPYTKKQMVDLFKLMSRLSGPNGIIRQTEFFVYDKKDKEALLEF